MSGIGPKTAKLITVSLAGKLIAPVASAPHTVVAGGAADSVLAALIGLGWSERAAQTPSTRRSPRHRIEAASVPRCCGSPSLGSAPRRDRPMARA